MPPMPPPGALGDAPEARLPERIGAFEILGVLGRGGMGVVFDARSPQGERVALKVIQSPTDGSRSGTLVARFLRESRILEQLNHPGIVRLIDAGDNDGTLYLAMERIEGVSLLAIRRQGPLNFEPVMQLGVHISDALGHLHAAGVVHRDIKPANILIQPSGQPVITDFGISGMSEATGITRQGDLLGSPGFMAPEVVNGAPPTPRSDQYALGRLLFELGARGPSRRLPRKAPIFEILRMAMQIDWTRFPDEGQWPDLAAILRRMVEADPAARYPDARAARDALEGLGHAVLDTDTLSEHVDQLALPSSTSYEALAHDLLSHPPEAATDTDLALEDLELPAGLRPRGPNRASEPEVEGAVALPPGRAADFLDPAEDDGADKTRIDAAPDTLPPDVPEGTVPTVAVVSDEAAATRPPPSPLAPTLEHTAPLDFALPTGLGPEAGTPRPLAELVQARGDEEAAAPSPHAAEVDRLERQLARARDEIATLRRQLAAPKPNRTLPWLLLAALTLLLGLALGQAIPTAAPERTSLVLVPSNPGAPTRARYEYGKDTMPSLQDRTDAAGLLAQAQEHFERRDLDAAERLLGLCIEVADLPDCHRTLGTMLTLTRDPSAQTHLERYLELAPDAPDANAIRAALIR